jgi:hypothetical protein
MILTAVDHGDNTGATLSVTSNSGTASVYVSRFMGTNASRAFVLGGTIVGNSNLVLPSLIPGPYVAAAVNAVPQISAPIFFRVTSEVEALHFRILEAVREYILSLALPSVSTDPDDHVVVKLPYRPEKELSIDTNTDCCAYYFPKAETYTGANNEDDTVSYSVQVLLARKIGSKLFQGLQTMLKDRQLIGQSMSRVPLQDVCEVHTVEIQPGAIYMPEHWQNSVDASSIVLKCTTELPAGIF